MEEAFKSYIEECNKTKALLLEWCDGRLKVERELLELAHQFDEWELEAVRIAIGSLAATGSDAAEGSSFVVMNCGMNAAGCGYKLPCTDSLRSRVNDTVGMLEQDKILTENLIKNIEAFKDKAALFLDKIVGFDGSRDILLPADTNVIRLIDVVRCLIGCHQNFSHPDFLSDMFGILVALKLSLQLAEVVRDITNLAIEGSRCRCRVAFQLRSIAEAAKWECCHLRHLLMQYLPVP